MPLTVVVVGAGIGGLAAAIALRQAGCEVTILERRHSITEIGYAIDVPPNATRILKRWGMDLNKLRGCHQYRLDVIKADVNPMKLLLSEERDIGGDAPFISVHRVDYHEALKEMALDEKAPGRPAVLRCNSKVTAYDPETGSVTLDSGDSIKADVIIAADGSGSKAHRWVVGEDLPAKPNGINNLRFVVPSSVMMQDPGMRTLVEATKGKMCVYVDSSGNYIAHYACRDYSLQNFGLYHEDDPAMSSKMLRSKKEIAQDRLGPVNKIFASLAGLVEEEGTYLWQIVERDPLKRLHNGRLVLVGDASHPMQPKLGQGAAQAVEDAAVLGVVLEGIASSAEIPNRLRIWEGLRRPRASAIQLMSRTNPSVQGWPNPEDEAKAREFFPPGELPMIRPEMTSWAFRYDAVAEAHAALDRHLDVVGGSEGP